MKKNTLIVILILLISPLYAQDGIRWMSMNEALDKNTFGNKDVIKYVNKNYYPVKFNAEGTESVTYQDFTYTNPNYQEGRKGRNSQHLLAHALKITGYPTIVFFKENGDLIQPVVGYKTPEQIEIFLKMIANDDYLKLTTGEAWQEYQNNFKGSFK
jgi:thioredoxin-related protein